jgi:hypothetical protein
MVRPQLLANISTASVAIMASLCFIPNTMQNTLLFNIQVVSGIFFYRAIDFHSFFSRPVTTISSATPLRIVLCLITPSSLNPSRSATAALRLLAGT